MHIGIYGSGYLATVLSSCVADFGIPVTCVDEDLSRITALSKGESPYFERNLAEIFRRGVRSGRLLFSTDLVTLAHRSQIIYLAQDTPEQVEQVAERIARTTVEPRVLVIASPVPVGTAKRIEQRIATLGTKLQIVSQPFFLTDGCAVEDFNWPDRILLGTASPEAVAALKDLYRPLVMRSVPVIVTSHETAELAREASTAFLATKISFINELAGLCEHVDADAVDLALALGLDKRIGPRCLQPGAALGGAFVEADLGSLGALAASKGVSLRVLEAARQVSKLQCEQMMGKLSSAIRLTGSNVGLLGLAFKPHTSSVASSASMLLAKSLVSQGAKVKAFDPAALGEAKLQLNGTVKYCENAYDVAEGADALIVSTGWPEFRALDFLRIKKTIKRPFIMDTKNILDGARMRQMGFQYVGVGRAG